MTAGLITWAIVASACRSDLASREGVRDPRGRRDIDELQRMVQSPRACDEPADCSLGSHCDDATATCVWACLADSECGTGRRCDLEGSCVANHAGAMQPLASDGAGCQALDPAELRAALLELNAQQFPCDSDEICPCGSHCSEDAECHVECLADDPTPDLTCGAGLACTPLGRCATAPNDPGPPLELTLALSEPVTTANTAAAPVVVPLAVTVAATSLAALSPTNPARVKLTIAEVRAFEQGRTDAAPAIAPRLRCASDAPLTSSCTLDGDWTFDVAQGQLRSAPKPIWVEIPQTTTPQQWTLEARSEWAADPAVDVLRAEPVIYPATDPGRYRGTLVLPNAGSDALALPIEAIVTATHIAVFEPTRIALPDGHVVMARDPAKATVVGWLSSGTARYDVVLGAPTATYQATTGKLDVHVSLATGTGAAPATIDLALARTGDVEAAPCPCAAAGTYCNASINRCLPGAGPPSGGIVDAAAAIPSSALPSTMLAAWLAPLEAVAPSVLQTATGITAVERAYCYRSPTEPGPPPPPARFAATTTLQPISGDLSCTPGTASPVDYAQPTFEFANSDHEFDSGSSGPAYDLFESCLADLAATPGGPPTTANLLSSKPCVSLGRFFLGLGANVTAGTGQPLVDHDQRILHQLIRQWLGVNSYVASAATQARSYDDALALSSVAANDRLRAVVDRVDDGLRVLLDRRVRPQYATGPGLPLAITQADYRVPLRPSVRWSFNVEAGQVPDVEDGFAPLTADDVELRNFDLEATAGYCIAEDAVALDDRHFTIAFHLRYTPSGGSKTVLFDKTGDDRLWLEATTPDNGAHLSLALKDSHGGVATFSAITEGFIAIAVNGSSYRLIHAAGDGDVEEVPAVQVLNAGPRWGMPGTVQLACKPPPNTASCTSWHRNVIGDYLDVATKADYVSKGTTTYHHTCKWLNNDWSCTGSEPDAAICAPGAAAKRAQIIQGLFPDPPAAATTGLTVTGVPFTIAELVLDNGKTLRTDWRCDNSVSHHLVPVTGVKPVCNQPPVIRWDEVSLWNRPIVKAELEAMSERYAGVTSNESLPPRSSPPLAGREQAAALPVHLVEAASADLDLLAQYIAAERAVIYEACYLGGGSPAGDRVAELTDRAGRNLRLIAILEAEAAHLAALPGAASAPWFPRYEAARRVLAGRRTRAVNELQLGAQCRNPLGITEDDLPLYVGEEVGPLAKFFASSRFLATKAKEEIALAQSKLAGAQAKYVEQRQNTYQLDQSRETKLLRETKLRADYESALVRYCGRPAGTQKLIDGFLAGTVTASNCFIKTEIPTCQGSENLPLSSGPPECLRGEIGARLLAIQAAAIEAENAKNQLHRTVEQFDSDMSYCARRQDELEEDEELLHAHNEHMRTLREMKLAVGFVAGLASAAARAKQGEVGGVIDTANGVIQQQLSSREAAEEARYQEEVARRSHAAELADCFHRADNEKFAIGAAKDVIKRATQDVLNAQFQLANDRDQIAGLIDAAAGQLGIEAQIDSIPPHLHYWLDTEISEYHRHLEYARRLTYLALRAVEYESQQQLGHRGETLTARRPGDLLAVVTAIEQRNAPMQGELGLVVGARPVVLSLRDEILRIADLASGTTPEQAFKNFLASSSSKILDAKGRYIGRGIRFSLRPAAWSETSCAERIWRLTPSLQIDNPSTQHGMVLYQDNAFGSQDCRAGFGAVTVARAQPSNNLLTGDSAGFGTPSSSTSLNIDGPLGLDHETLRARPEGDISGLAGRGLYGSYVLLFPPQTWTDAQIAKVKDVLFRFDIVEVTHASPL